MRQEMASACFQTMPSPTSERPPSSSKRPQRPLSVVRRGSTPLYKGRVSPTESGDVTLPEKELLSRYRHVYAGRGGLYGYKTGPNGPITNQNGKNPRYVDRYKREILQKLSKTLLQQNAGGGDITQKGRQTPAAAAAAAAAAAETPSSAGNNGEIVTRTPELSLAGQSPVTDVQVAIIDGDRPPAADEILKTSQSPDTFKDTASTGIPITASGAHGAHVDSGTGNDHDPCTDNIGTKAHRPIKTANNGNVTLTVYDKDSSTTSSTRPTCSSTTTTCTITTVTSNNNGANYEEQVIDSANTLVHETPVPQSTGPNNRHTQDRGAADHGEGSQGQIIQASSFLGSDCLGNACKDSGSVDSLNATREIAVGQLKNIGLLGSPTVDLDTVRSRTPLTPLDTTTTTATATATTNRLNNIHNKKQQLKTVRSCPSRLNQQESVQPPAPGRVRPKHPATATQQHQSKPSRSRPRKDHNDHKKFQAPRGRPDVFSRMSLEARHAINETRREMGLADNDDDDNFDDFNNQEVTSELDIDVPRLDNRVSQRGDELDDKNNNNSGSNCTEVYDTSYQDDLVEADLDQEEFKAGRGGNQQQESGKDVQLANSGSVGNLQQISASPSMSMELVETKQGVAKYRTRKGREVGESSPSQAAGPSVARLRKTRGGVTVNQTRETAFTSTDIALQDLQQQQQQNARKHRNTPRTHQQQHRRPRTKLPEINYSHAEGRESLGELNSPRAQPDRRIPGVGNYRVLPVTRVPRREGTFEITPPGYDSRFRDMRRSDLDVPDDTPEEVKARAIEKCQEWMNKYWS